MMTRKQAMILASAAVIAAAGAGTGAAVAASGSPGQLAASASASASPGYSWSRSVMTGYYGSGSGSGMMGNSSYGWMMSEAGYRWMTGGAGSPGWMTGALPSAMMGTGMMGGSTDPGKVMGSLFAGAPGPRVSTAQAAALGSQVPAGAQVSTAANTITFTTTAVRLTILGSPAGGPDETFRAAGLVNPRIIIPAGAHVTVNLINADPGTAHGLVITASSATGSWMPMMTARPAFTGSALWFLGNPTSAGMHQGTIAFTAAAPGTYRYLCPVPGHAQKGMSGTFTVQLQITHPMSPEPGPVQGTCRLRHAVTMIAAGRPSAFPEPGADQQVAGQVERAQVRVVPQVVAGVRGPQLREPSGTSAGIYPVGVWFAGRKMSGTEVAIRAEGLSERSGSAPALTGP